MHNSNSHPWDWKPQSALSTVSKTFTTLVHPTWRFNSSFCSSTLLAYHDMGDTKKLHGEGTTQIHVEMLGLYGMVPGSCVLHAAVCLSKTKCSESRA